MPKFTIEYTATEVIRQRIEIEAENEQEALDIIEDHAFDNSFAWDHGSPEWTASKPEIVKDDVEQSGGDDQDDDADDDQDDGEDEDEDNGEDDS